MDNSGGGRTVKYLDNRYVKVLSHRGYDICTLKSACPISGDSLGYVINHSSFKGHDYNTVDDAIKAIDEQ